MAAERQETCSAPETEDCSGRFAWIRPTVERLEAGGAEAGPNPTTEYGIAS
jgi:hypothetical protein